ncbi:MAG: magnesium transporter [Bdellovibrionales bacterium]|nr:magnesium transporter [Bdellovibrionales bacterium]
MSEDRSKMLAMTIQKLHARGAKSNIQNILEKAHAADIAEMLAWLTPEDRYQIFTMIENEDDRSEVMSHMDEDIQRELVSILSKEDVLKLVTNMERDDAADLLGLIPENEADEILSSMVKEDSQEVAGLMGYPEDSAGGLMSSDYLALQKSLTVGQVIDRIQQEGDEGKVSFYVYVVNENNQLIGVSSLKQLLLSKRNDVLGTIMFTEVISVDVTAHQEDVAKMVEKYDFLSLPVVTGNNELVGVITVDDVIDVIREEAEEDLLAMGRAGLGLNVTTREHFLARLPWLLFAYATGIACFAIVYLFESLSESSVEFKVLWLAAAFVPMLLSMSATTGSQSATVFVGYLRAGGFDLSKAKKQWGKEAWIGLIFSILFGSLTFFVSLFFNTPNALGILFSLTLAFQIVIAMIIGSTIPVLMDRFDIDPTVASVPVFTSLADVTAIAILFTLLHNW